MKVIDNTINYYELLMIYNDTSNYKKYELPNGFHYELFKNGDINNWININISSGLFMSYDEGFKCFHDFFDSFIDELDKRCVFIVDDLTNEKVATVTVSLLSKEKYGCMATIDWFSIKKEYQGRGLSKPLISKFIGLSKELGHKKIMLHTQTITPLAAKLYLDSGFDILNKEEVIGWKILKRLTNHEKLKDYIDASDEEMYDKRNIEIEKELNRIFGKNNYNYSVWYKDSHHDVIVNSKNEVFKYEYFINDEELRLKRIKVCKQ